MLADILLKIAAETQEKKEGTVFRPSMAGPERCVRSLVYQAAGVPSEPFPGRAIMVFDDSSWHEALTADWIRRTAYKLHSEQMEVDTPVGKGHIDGVLTDLLGVDRLLEHKGLNHFSFERIWKGQWPLDYFTQCALYIVGLRKLNPNIDEAVLLVKNKNTSAYLECCLQYDANSDSLTLKEVVRSDGQRENPTFMMERVTWAAVEKFNLVGRYVKEGTLPPRPFEVGEVWPCSYCRWASKCWETFTDEFEALGESPELDQDIHDLAAYYLEVHGHVSEMDKEKKGLRDKIRTLLEERGLKGGTAGPYVITRRLQPRSGLDEDLIPPSILEQARTKTFSEIINIRMKKEAKKR